MERNNLIKWLQLLCFGLLMLITGTQFDFNAQAVAHNQPVSFSPWQLSHMQHLHQYVTHGSGQSEQFFGALKPQNHCANDVLVLALSSTSSAVTDFQGRKAYIQIVIGSRRGLIEVPILGVLPREDGYLVMLSNFIIDQHLRDDLTSARQLDIDVVAPKGLVDLLNSSQESFVLRGFSNARQQSFENCTQTKRIADSPLWQDFSTDTKSSTVASN